MDRRERYGDPEEMLRMAQDGHQSRLWTALPGIIQSFDPVAMTCTVQPAISGQALQQDGSLQPLQMPVLLDCPVFFPSGGGVTLTFPIQQGDECLVVFASRCIDGWWQLGGVQAQAETRMHDLSDGFVLCGVRSQPRKFTVGTSTAQLRSDDGAAFVEVNPTTHDIKAQTTGNINIIATGNVNVTASGTATVSAPSIILKNLGSALKKLCTETFMALYNTHTHNETGTVTGPPNQPGTAGTHTTTIVQAE